MRAGLLVERDEIAIATRDLGDVASELVADLGVGVAGSDLAAGEGILAGEQELIAVPAARCCAPMSAEIVDLDEEVLLGARVLAELVERMERIGILLGLPFIVVERHPEPIEIDVTVHH